MAESLFAAKTDGIEEVSTRILDIPDISNVESRAFSDLFWALADTPNIDIFGSLTIKLLVTQAWKETFPTLFWTSIFPFLIQLVAYEFWNHWMIPIDRKL